MKALLLKGANWILLIGLFLTCYGIYDAFNQRNVSATPQAVELASLANYDGELSNVTISGGRLDVANTYEYTREKRGKVRSRDFYAPVLNADNQPVYIMQFEAEPTLEMAFKEAEYTGLLQPASALPDKILEAYTSEFGHSNFYMLETDFTHQSLGDRIGKIGFFFVIFLVGFGLRKLLTRKPAVTQQETEA